MDADPGPERPAGGHRPEAGGSHLDRRVRLERPVDEQPVEPGGDTEGGQKVYADQGQKSTQLKPTPGGRRTRADQTTARLLGVGGDPGQRMEI